LQAVAGASTMQRTDILCKLKLECPHVTLTRSNRACVSRVAETSLQFKHGLLLGAMHINVHAR
jgi:hypothetical protein